MISAALFSRSIRKLGLKRRGRGWWWGGRKLTAGGFLILLILGTYGWFPWLRGSTVGTTVAGVVPFTDPLAMLEIILASHSFAWKYLVGGLLLIGVTLILGPVFCGWLCPLGLLLELNQELRFGILRILHGRGQLTPPINSGRQHNDHRWIKFGLLGGVLGFSFAAGIPIFQAVSPINILARGILFGMTVWLVVIVGLVFLEWWLPRVWCRDICPLGALYGFIGRFAPLRVRVDPTLAGRTACGQCDRACPMGIRVLADQGVAESLSITHEDCTRCGACTEVCPRGVLRLGFRDRGPTSNASPPGEGQSPSAGESCWPAGRVALTVDDELI